MKFAYFNGSSAALARYDVKLAFTDGLNEDEEESHTGRNLAMAGAAALPMAGMIGQQKMVNRDQGPLYDNYHALRKQMQPGDILLTGAKEMSLPKAAISSVTGTPEGYHVAMVSDHNGNLVHSHPAFGFKKDKIQNEASKTERIQLLRPTGLSPAEVREQVRQTKSLAHKGVQLKNSITDNLSDAYTRRDAAGYGGIGRGGLYDSAQGMKAGLKELFVPKFTGNEAAELDKVKAQTARKHFDPKAVGAQIADYQKIKNTTERTGVLGAMDKLRDRLGDATDNFADAKPTSVPRALLRDIVDKIPSHGATTGEEFTRMIPDCVGGVCSTVPATSFPKGKNVVSGKLPSEVLPSDYLRSKNYTSVGRYNPFPKSTLHEKLLRHGPTLARAGAGAALAGGVYAGSKLWDSYRAKKEKGAETPSSSETSLR